MPKPIHEVAADVLVQFKRPMTADEIYNAIVAGNLYAFKTQAAKSVVRSQLRRHSENITGPNQAAKASFKLLEDNRYTLLGRK